MDDVRRKMSKVISVLKADVASVRAGRANPAILEKIKIDYYGTLTPVTQMSNITVPDGRTLLIQPWDAEILKEIEKSLLKSDLGLNPSNDGKCIRINFPPLTEERRLEIIKMVRKYGEESKVSIRNVRRDAIEHSKNQKKEGEITEDGLKTAENEIQKITDKNIKEIDDIVLDKERELAEI